MTKAQKTLPVTTDDNTPRFSYTAQRRRKASLTAILSAEWDTARDAALAAKLRFDLTPEQMTALEAGELVALPGGYEIILNMPRV